MLNKTATDLGMTIANNASSRGIQMSAMPGTPLKAVVTTLLAVGDKEYANKGGEALIKASQSHPLNVHNHQDEKVDIVNNLRTIIENKTLRTIQEDLNPLIRDIRTEVSRQRVAIAEENALGLDIAMHELSPVYSSSYIETLVGTGLRDVRNYVINQSLRRRLVGDLSTEAIVTTIATPSNDLNAQLAELVTRQNEDSVDGVASTLLTMPTTGLLNIYNDHSDLITFLFLRGVKADKHPYVKLDSLSTDERTELARMISYYQSVLNTRLKAYNRMSESNKVFLEVRGNVIHVIGKNYMAWTEKEEHTKEAVFGAVIRHGVRAAEILHSTDNFEELEKAYKNHAVVSRSKTATMADSKVEEITRNFIVRHINEEAETSENAAASRSMDLQSVRDYFSVFRKDKLTSDEEFITRAVCKTVGRGIDAEVVILEMQRFLEQEGNEDLELSTALQYAVTCLLARYMARQTVTEKLDLNHFGTTALKTA